MVFAPQRRHVVVSLSSTMQALALVQHLYSPNTMVLICRVVSHINIRAPAIIQPSRSLLGLFFLVLLTNVAAVLLHLVDFSSGSNSGKGLILDFVGQANIASFARIVLLDIAIFLLQLATLMVSYVNNYTATLPKSDHFPYDDLLLPPAAPTPAAEPDVDIETGDQFRQRRHGKGPRYHNVPEEGEVWFDEEEEEDPLLGATPQGRVFPDVSRTRSRRSGGAPLIFNITTSHLFNLIFRLPNPIPPRLFSGGTPSTSAPGSPTQESVRTLVNALAEAQARAEANTQSNIQRLAASTNGLSRSPAPAAPAPVTEDAGATGGDDHSGSPQDSGPHRSAREGRIPGDYWTSRATG